MYGPPKRGSGQSRTAPECAQLLPLESRAARGTPEEEAQAAAVGRRGPFRPSLDGQVEALFLTVPRTALNAGYASAYFPGLMVASGRVSSKDSTAFHFQSAVLWP